VVEAVKKAPYMRKEKATLSCGKDKNKIRKGTWLSALRAYPTRGGEALSLGFLVESVGEREKIRPGKGENQWR